MKYDENRDWEKMAKEYKQEIEHLWKDMLTVAQILDEKAPRSIQKAQVILDRAIETSEKAVDEIRRFN